MSTEPTCIFIPEGVTLDLTEIRDDLIIFSVKGCKPNELRMLKGNVEVKVQPFPKVDHANDDN